ncbi:MAG: superoxide dismutase [Lachnospiraceae bacterium]|jgi:Fe-Mn family superoxide dismutase|nr:superoxide dismutase [Lachnospiraceae bacterium]
MQDYYKFVNEPLPYSYKAMEPYIDIQTMYLHHDKHLQAYVDNLNKTLEDFTFLHNFTLEQLLNNLESIPEEIRTSVKNNAGGVFNHRFYFNCLANPSLGGPCEKLEEAINREFGSYENFKQRFTQEALSVFGSGYAWLVVNQKGDLQIIQTANQETPLAKHFSPILVIDVWEHAYYLKHFNRRDAYIKDWFQVVNWDFVKEQYQGCPRRKLEMK